MANELEAAIEIIVENNGTDVNNATPFGENATLFAENTMHWCDISMPSNDVLWAAFFLALLLILHHTIRLCTRRKVTLHAELVSTSSTPGQEQ